MYFGSYVGISNSRSLHASCSCHSCTPVLVLHETLVWLLLCSWVKLVWWSKSLKSLCPHHFGPFHPIVRSTCSKLLMYKLLDYVLTWPCIARVPWEWMAMPLLTWCLSEQSMVPRQNLGPRVYGCHPVVSLGARWYQDMRRHDITSRVKYPYPLSWLQLTLRFSIHKKNQFPFLLHCYLIPLFWFTLPFLIRGKPTSIPLFVHIFPLTCLTLSFLNLGNDQFYVHT